MQLQSLLLRGEGVSWDLSAPEIISVDDLILLRKSGEYEELGDIPAEDFRKLAEELLLADSLPEDEKKMVKTLIRD